MRIIRWLLLVCLVSVLISALISVMMTSYRHIIKEREKNLSHRTKIGMQNLEMILSTYYVIHEKFPGPNFSDVTAALSSPEFSKDFKVEDKRILEGYDAWGNPLFYKKISPTIVIIRSFGANGVNDDGQGDDITFCIDDFAEEKLPPDSPLPTITPSNADAQGNDEHSPTPCDKKRK